MSRRLTLLLGLVLCCVAQARAEPRIELTLTPAWKGWSRPGRMTEIDVRMSSDGALRASFEVSAARQLTTAALELQPGRVTRLQVAIGSAPGIDVRVDSAGTSTIRRDVRIAQSESPLLGVGLAADRIVQLDGFHAVALAADDFPRSESAFSSIDALILDAPTLAGLDQKQLAALVGFAASCGRLVVVGADARVRRALDGAAGCGHSATMNASSAEEARSMLGASLATRLPQPLAFGNVAALAQPAHAAWNWVAVLLAVYLAAASLALIHSSSLPTLLLAPAVAVAVTLTLMHQLKSTSQLVVWSEGETGAQLARYQAVQRFPGNAREHARVAVPPQLGASVQACDPVQPMHFELDATGQRVEFAEFDTRLFHQVALCYAGSFPMLRTIAVAARGDGAETARNAGSRAWPQGSLIVAGKVRDLPALDPGASAVIGAASAPGRRDDALRTALTRTPADGTAALWQLDLAGVAGAPIDSQGWLLVSIPPP
ncbi:MAG: hypothetical protein ABI745_02765 [Caldimonas sp.]